MLELQELEKRYETYLRTLKYTGILGYKIEDCRALWYLVQRANEAPSINRICDLALGNLSAVETFQDDRAYPEQYHIEEQLRREVTRQTPLSLKAHLDLRVGTAGSYTVALALLLRIPHRTAKLTLCQAAADHPDYPGHYWIELADGKAIDLFTRSQGRALIENPRASIRTEFF